MGNQTSTYNPARESAELGRRPNDYELILLFKMQTKFLVRLVECPYHVSLLERYWDSMHGNHANNNQAVSFQRKGPGWRTIGFTTDNPADDVRATGELGLECLVFFVENYPGEARMMNRRVGGYPFVKAAVAVTRVVIEIFHIVEADGSRGQYPVRDTLYWQILEDDASLFRLFAFCFLMFDELFCDWVASTKTLPQAVCPTSTVARLADLGKNKLLATLMRAPEHLTDLTDLCANGQVLRRTNLKLNVHDHKPKSSPWGPTSTRQPSTATQSPPFDLFEGLVQK
ncbi:hypothetical protein H310_07458 [Aphanomyces invadans]|uniref:ELMO domain-containing protein n=1 Tax=Aphanomyces invadans TaxID=157072 RepID=A0A024U342_9STRA|nr:hypothetical protein H310_07458 [Aphanomyces invadans]ETW00018.1 hypothetical protein H310_07458 [Aphanomyces invadans]|eukprot:XP_008871043.1 hypothetical protein H310_07458 [Aphanomyces invadans]